jgi:hypothetical protein
LEGLESPGRFAGQLMRGGPLATTAHACWQTFGSGPVARSSPPQPSPAPPKAAAGEGAGRDLMTASATPSNAARHSATQSGIRRRCRAAVRAALSRGPGCANGCGATQLLGQSCLRQHIAAQNQTALAVRIADGRICGVTGSQDSPNFLPGRNLEPGPHCPSPGFGKNGRSRRQEFEIWDFRLELSGYRVLEHPSLRTKKPPANRGPSGGGGLGVAVDGFGLAVPSWGDEGGKISSRADYQACIA